MTGLRRRKRRPLDGFQGEEVVQGSAVVEFQQTKHIEKNPSKTKNFVSEKGHLDFTLLAELKTSAKEEMKSKTYVDLQGRLLTEKHQINKEAVVSSTKMYARQNGTHN